VEVLAYSLRILIRIRLGMSTITNRWIVRG
jgi:hypothetical protein